MPRNNLGLSPGSRHLWGKGLWRPEGTTGALGRGKEAGTEDAAAGGDDGRDANGQVWAHRLSSAAGRTVEGKPRGWTCLVERGFLPAFLAPHPSGHQRQPPNLPTSPPPPSSTWTGYNSVGEHFPTSIPFHPPPTPRRSACPSQLSSYTTVTPENYSGSSPLLSQGHEDWSLGGS